MKTFTLPLLVAIAITGYAFAEQTPHQPANQINSHQPNKTVTQSSDKDNSESTQGASQDSAETENKSLNERERERKGLPRYWHG